MMLSVYSDSLLSFDFYRGGVIFFKYCPQVLVLYGKNNLSNDQEVAQPKPNPDLKAEIMK